MQPENEPQDIKQQEIKASKEIAKFTIKDSVFTNLFQDKKYLMQLYQALHPEDTEVTEEELTDITIKNVLTDNLYNDLGFLVGNRLMILAEAQSSWTVNILVRALMYLMQTYQDYFEKNKQNLYGSKKIKMPKPELYVIFIGERVKKPEYISLSTEFFGGQECAIDAKAKVIYDGKEGDIINQYVIFTRVYNEQRKLYGRTKEAIMETIRICKDRNVLKEYLESKEKEVVNIMMVLYDEEQVLRSYIESERHEAALEAALKAALEADREASIRTLIETCQDFGASVTDTIAKIVLKFKLSEVDSKEKVQQYWK